MSVDIAVVGSLNLDRIYSMARLPTEGETLHAMGPALSSGGKGANQAVAAARLGVRVSLVGSVGDDDAGRRLLHLVSADGVDTAPVRRSTSSSTGEAVIFVSEAGENLIVITGGANADLTAGDVRSNCPDAAWVVSGFEVSDECVVEAAKCAHEIGASFVLNPSPYRTIPEDLIGRVSVMVMNEHELAAATADSLEVDLVRLGESLRLALRAETLIVTLGARGAAVVTAAGSIHVPAPTVTPVDTSGAGDAFTGALVARLAAGDDLEHAVTIAVAAGAFATTRRGTQASYPTVNELDQWSQTSAR